MSHSLIPEFITHYNRGEPFRSVTQSSSHLWPHLIQQLTNENSWGVQRFADPEYLTRRLAVEKLMRDEFIKMGGKPKLNNPIYFFLGRHSGFEGHSANIGYTIDLSDVLSETISFTYGDSMFSYDQGYRRQSGEKYQNPLCAQIYRQEELPTLFRDSHYPTNEPLSVEAHLWEIPAPEHVKILQK